MGHAIGIDLGTTNSVAAISRGGEARVLLNQSNQKSTASVVALHKKSGQEIVGTAALDYAPANPENAVISIKRLVGRHWEDAEVQRAIRRYAYQIVKSSDGEDVRVRLGEKTLTPTEISGRILRKIKDDAEYRLRGAVTHAVITVPAYFTNLQRICTRQAGELAGLRVKAIVDEPTAAAIAFGVDSASEEGQTILVFDFGGGTFDVAVLFMVGESSVNQMDIEGDMWLGGDDVDHRIMDLVVGDIERRHGSDVSNDKRCMLLLKRACERAKVDLSEMMSTSVVLLAAFRDESGEIVDVDYDLSREHLTRVIQDLVEDRAMVIVRRALAGAGLGPAEVDAVLLVGGSSSLPIVQQALAREFGEEKLRRSVDPMTCVALGASILAERIDGQVCPDKECQGFNAPDAGKCVRCGITLSSVRYCNACCVELPSDADHCPGCGVVRKPTISLGGITSRAIGLETRSGRYEVLIPKGTNYPMLEDVQVVFVTTNDSQRKVRIRVYHGEDEDGVSTNEFLGAADIPLTGNRLLAGSEIEVALMVDRDGCLSIRASVRGRSEEAREIQIDPRLGQQPPVDDDVEEYIENDLGWSISCAGMGLETYGWYISPTDKVALERAIRDAMEITEKKAWNRAREAEQRLDQAMQAGFGPLWACLWWRKQFDDRETPAVPGAEMRRLCGEIEDLVRMGSAHERVVERVKRLECLFEDENRRRGNHRDFGTGIERRSL